MTVSHIVATTHLRGGKKEEIIGQEYLSENGITIIKELQKQTHEDSAEEQVECCYLWSIPKISGYAIL